MAALTVSDTKFHITKAERNEEFYHSCGLEKSRFNEWCVVVLFYVAMHYIDAVLFQDASLTKNMQNPKDHKVRTVAVSQCAKLNHVATMYSNLRDRCWEARYHKICFPDGYLHNFTTRVFEPTRTYLRKTLGLTN